MASGRLLQVQQQAVDIPPLPNTFLLVAAEERSRSRTAQNDEIDYRKGKKNETKTVEMKEREGEWIKVEEQQQQDFLVLCHARNRGLLRGR